jgi:hypothetical protein
MKAAAMDLNDSSCLVSPGYSRFYHKPLMMDECRGAGLLWWQACRLRIDHKPLLTRCSPATAGRRRL